MATGTYIADGLFDLMPTYQETVQFNFETQEFVPSSHFDDGELDFDYMYLDARFTKDRALYNKAHKYDRP